MVWCWSWYYLGRHAGLECGMEGLECQLSSSWIPDRTLHQFAIMSFSSGGAWVNIPCGADRGPGIVLDHNHGPSGPQDIQAVQVVPRTIMQSISRSARPGIQRCVWSEPRFKVNCWNSCSRGKSTKNLLRSCFCVALISESMPLFYENVGIYCSCCTTCFIPEWNSWGR